MYCHFCGPGAVSLIAEMPALRENLGLVYDSEERGWQTWHIGSYESAPSEWRIPFSVSARSNDTSMQNIQIYWRRGISWRVYQNPLRYLDHHWLKTRNTNVINVSPGVTADSNRPRMTAIFCSDKTTNERNSPLFITTCVRLGSPRWFQTYWQS